MASAAPDPTAPAAVPTSAAPSKTSAITSKDVFPKDFIVTSIDVWTAFLPTLFTTVLVVHLPSSSAPFSTPFSQALPATYFPRIFVCSSPVGLVSGLAGTHVQSSPTPSNFITGSNAATTSSWLQV